MVEDSDEFYGKVQRCFGHKINVECPYEGLPCCKQCYPLKKAWVQKKLEDFEGLVQRYEMTGLYTTAEITCALKGGQRVRNMLVRKLDTPRKESGWDGCMDKVRLALKLGGESYQVIWE